MLHLCVYDINTERILCTRLFFFKKQVLWQDVAYVKLLQTTKERSVTLALYGGDRLLLDLSSPMKHFWSVQRLAEHLGYEVAVVTDPSVRAMHRP